MRILYITESGRDILLNLTTDQRDRVLLALLVGSDAGDDWEAPEWFALKFLREENEEIKQKKAKKSEYNRRYYQRQKEKNASSEKFLKSSESVLKNSERLLNFSEKVLKDSEFPAPSPAPSPPFLPPSSLSPTTPISSPPYNPPSTSPSPDTPLYPPPRKTGFDRFWAAYPRKVGKQAARKSWSRLKPSAELTQRILDAVECQKGSRQWRENNGQFIPNPATWLNQGRWEDELVKEDDPFARLPNKGPIIDKLPSATDGCWDDEPF
jgi:hypothetical protein